MSGLVFHGIPETFTKTFLAGTPNETVVAFITSAIENEAALTISVPDEAFNLSSDIENKYPAQPVYRDLLDFTTILISNWGALSPNQRQNILESEPAVASSAV